MSLEAKVISAVCKNKDISTVFTENIDTLFTSHADVWLGLKAYYHQFNAVPDVTILEDRFKDFESVDTKGETAFYVNDLKDEFLRSSIRQAIMRAGRGLESDSGARVLQEIQKELLSLNRLTSNVRDLDITDSEDAETHYDAVRMRSALMGGSPGIPTGFKAMDASYVTGMAPGHLIVAIGWPGRGKTWMTGKLAVNAWKQGFKPMIVSLEMTPETMRDRLYTIMGEGTFRNSDLARGNVNVDDFRSWSKKSFEDKNGFVIVSSEGMSDVTPNLIQGKIDQHKPDIVICDYHQLFMDNRRSENMTTRAMNLSRELKLLAVNNNIPVIDIVAATQDDAHSQDDPPTLRQVAWSKAIEYDADMAFAVHQHPETNIIEVISRKSRHGSAFGFYLDWDINLGVVREHSGQVD